VGTAITYQGRLSDGGVAANGSYDLRFILYDALNGGAQVGTIVSVENVGVTDGFFTTTLDFGAGVFSGDARYVEVGVRPGASIGNYTILSPRQPVTPAPYALFALNDNLSDGVQIGTVAGDGVYVASAGDDGVEVDVATDNGFQVNSAGKYGLHVGSAADDGVNVASASDHGFRLGTSNNDGVHLEDAGSDGLRVLSAGDDGVDIDSADDNGIQIDSASGDGIHVGDADGWAGYFDGNVSVTGSLSKGAGGFRIDHPLDPENKYLQHSFVESPDMLNLYSGNVTLDAQGQAWVKLPIWFEALNRDYRYQLTPIGRPGPNLYIAEEVQRNRFKIAGGTAGLRVSWQVSGVRHDPYAVANPIVVEEDKAPEEVGRYLQPEAYGLPSSMEIDAEESDPASISPASSGR
jgi:hypothetical protein